MSDNENTKNSLPVLPIRDIIVFPDMTVPLFVGREKSVQALNAAMNSGKKIITIAQKDSTIDDPKASDLHTTGTVCYIHSILKLPDGSIKVLLQGQARAKVSELVEDGAYLKARAETLNNHFTPGNDLEASKKLAIEAFKNYANASGGKIPAEVVNGLDALQDDPSKLADAIAAHMEAKLSVKQEVLEEADVAKRLQKVWEVVAGQMSIIETQQRIQRETKKSIEEGQREYFLREQQKAIRKELGEEEEDDTEVFTARIEAMNPNRERTAEEAGKPVMTQDAHSKAVKELKKLKAMSPASSEATVTRNYLDALLSVPWNVFSAVNSDTTNAREILDEEHYGLDKVKGDVIEHLAIQKRLHEKGLDNAELPTIMCLVGPPGVGKTSICRSLAHATGREYVRIALGGVNDEAEIRGHRRTYVGSKPGKIMEKMTKVGTTNPLFVLDEIDKLGDNPMRGSPASALLEVLDPEQNNSFSDHYLEVDYDLSKVMFICTANDPSNIPGPLKDRMNVIFLGSYTEDEKLEIAKRHLVSKQMRATGLDANEFSVDDNALRDLIRYYTKESGVRTLQRQIGKLCAKVVMELEDKSKTSVAITSENLEKYAGQRKFRSEGIDAEDRIGVVNGLYWSEAGGGTLTIESVKLPKENESLIVTGNLKDVMKESIRVAMSLAKMKAQEHGYEKSLKNIKENTIHLHIPEGATPKDGPSAGSGMLTVLFSLITGKPVRRDIAMTGEVNLRGQVTAIGGLREKLAGAVAAGCRKVLIPEDNVRDLSDVPAQITSKLEIVPVRNISEVLRHALVDGTNLTAPAEEKLPVEAATVIPPANQMGPQLPSVQ